VREWQKILPMDEAAALERFQESYRGTGLEVRFYPRCISCFRWQLGKNGGEYFELLCYASSPSVLLERIRERAFEQARNGSDA
jgi:hypothetical protein